MKLCNDTKIALIGFGFLLEFLSPCYMRFFDEKNVKTNIVAVTADEKNCAAKNARYPFEVKLGGNLQMLKDLTPHIILFAPPPKVAPALIEDTLKPYFAHCRQNGLQLPDVYAFPPSPQASYYLQQLGEDANVCNILPNMMNEINGKPLGGKEGNTYISYPKQNTWNEQSRENITQFFSYIGNVIEIPPEKVLDMLGTLATHEAISFLAYDISDALKGTLLETPENDCAESLRAILQKETGYKPEGSLECKVKCTQELEIILAKIIKAWANGAQNYLLSVGFEEKLAQQITVPTLDINLHGAQAQTREFTETELKNHATKGGVAERAELCYNLLVRQKIVDTLKKMPLQEPGENFYKWVESVVYNISEIVAIHGRRLANSDYALDFKIMHHALLYTMFVRNANAIGGESAKAAIDSGTALYAKQRGTRMKKRTLLHGDKNDMLGYQIYGEWAAPNGELLSRTSETLPTFTIEVDSCPWYAACEGFGYLEELKQYCKKIDEMLVKAYNSELELGVLGLRPFGDKCCNFKWNGLAMDDEATKYLEKRRSELGTSCKKDWKYHTQHMYSAMCEEILKLEKGEDIVKKTLEDFEVVFGTSMKNIAVDCKDVDFFSI